MKNSLALTIMELLVVIVIIGVICAFAIPNYRKTQQLTYERQAIQALALIREARKLYVARTGAEMPLPLNNIPDINQALNINIVEDKITIYCNVPAYAAYQCCATSSFGWSLHFEAAHDTWPEGVIHCSTEFAGANNCPSCPSSSSGCSHQY